MKKRTKFVLLLVVLFLGVNLWYLDFSEPAVTWNAVPSLGKNSQLELKFQDEGKGLRRIEVRLSQGNSVYTIFAQDYPLTKFPWQQAPVLEDVVFSSEDWISDFELEQGVFELFVRVEDQSNVWLFSRTTEETRSFNLDTKPPRIDVHSDQHYVRQGGSEAVLYQVAEENCTSGVQVGPNSFRGYPVAAHGEGFYIALFALAHDQDLETPILLWAEDAAGNRSETRFWYKSLPGHFRKRRMQITDRFIDSVAPEILSHSTTIKEQDTPLGTFLQINQVLREENNLFISEITRVSSPTPLWSEPFLQLSNSKVESVFADRRTYYYAGEAVDEQTHLGFDLASLAHSAVEASNSGKVIFADYLGIYGNCVILDHGLGLFSLYGHLSTIEVDKEQNVARGEALGQTGQTGLAGGDHLHYSMIVQGIQVSPVEWWDPNWLRLHVLGKLRKLEREDST